VAVRHVFLIPENSKQYLREIRRETVSSSESDGKAQINKIILIYMHSLSTFKASFEVNILSFKKINLNFVFNMKKN